MQPRKLQLIPQVDDQPAPLPEVYTCATCGRPLRVILQKLRPHRTKPGFEMYEVYARCTRPLRHHRFVSWAEYDPRTGGPLPPVEFIAEG